MWQRIQTLYLMIGILLNGSIFWLSIANVKLDTVDHSFSLYKLATTDGGEAVSSTILLAIICSVVITILFAAIFLYKKRQLQIKVAQLSLLLQAGFLAAIFFTLDNMVSSLTNETHTIDYNVGAYMALIPLIFIFLAIRGIKKDEALVRAADRIR